jgi:dihydroorotase
MAVQDLLLKNALIVNEGKIFRGSLLIRNGRISQLFGSPETRQEAYPEDVRTLDLDGLYLLPGVIDDQVHFRDPGLTHKGDIASESSAAVAGGITSFMEMPNTLPQTISQKALEEKFALGQQKSLANFSFYMGATNDNIGELQATDSRNVCGIKVFMGASTGNMLVDMPESLAAIFRLTRIPIAVHCEDEPTIQANLAIARKYYGDNIPVHQHPVIRNHEACETSSRLAVSLAERYGTRLHLLHLSTANELRFLDRSTPLHEKRITAEACIHHLWFTRRDYKEKGTFIKWNPAVKDGADREALIQGLAEGLIDVVATDHAPHTSEEKQKPYLECPSGGPMVQHSLVAMLEFFHRGRLPLEKIVDLMCHNPATIFGIKDRGFIREGYAADLVAVDLDSPWQVTGDNILYKCGWSPMDGTTFKSSVVHTFVNGNHVFDRGETNTSVKGEALKFSR